MQPAQLSLLPNQIPPPTPIVLFNLPEADISAAISLLGALIAKASMTAPTTAPDVEVDGDD